MGLDELPESGIPDIDAGHSQRSIARGMSGEVEISTEPADVGARGDVHLDIPDLGGHLRRREKAVEQGRDPIRSRDHHPLRGPDDGGIHGR
jgi:hypothetical protein